MAWRILIEAEVRLEANLPIVSHKFKEVARIAIKNMETEVKNKRGRVIYKEYIGVINNYLIPYFGNLAIDKIQLEELDNFGVWRTEKTGRTPGESTVATHNAGINNLTFLVRRFSDLVLHQSLVVDAKQHKA